LDAGRDSNAFRDQRNNNDATSERMTGLLLPRARTLITLVVAAALLATATAAFAAEGNGPAMSAGPKVAGSPTEGSRLVASPGSWDGTGTITYTYQWFRCDTMGAHCKPLVGVTERTRLVGSNDVGRTLSLRVRATDSRGTTTAYASLVGPIAGVPSALALKGQPSVSGDSVLGATVRVDPGSWTPAPEGFSFQWARCNGQGRACVPISGATGDTHEIATADLGHPLVAIVQARSRAESRAVFSAATTAAVKQLPTKPQPVKPQPVKPQPVTPQPPPTTTQPTTPATPPPGTPGAPGVGPSITSAPMVATVLKQGVKLSGAPGSWSGSGEIRHSFQWFRCDATGAHCKSIHGATASTYTPVAKDVGQTLGFAVGATDATGTSTAYASLIGPVPATNALLVSAAQPVVTGTPGQGQPLQVTTGAWTLPPTTFVYQWQRCNPNGRICVPIPGATTNGYTPAAEDVGHALVAVVGAQRAGVTQNSFSVATRPIVAAGPALTAPPTAAGVFQQGARLTGSTGTWSSVAGAIGYEYQWYRCDSAGAHCKSISGATRPTYMQVAKDVGQTLGFAVRATDPAGTTTTFAGLVGPVAGVQAKLVANVQPAITGPSQQGQILQTGTGAWNQVPTAFTYQWQRCNANGRLCSAIAGATASSYALTPGDVGHTVVALVQATSNGVTQAVFSTTTAAVS